MDVGRSCAVALRKPDWKCFPPENNFPNRMDTYRGLILERPAVVTVGEEAVPKKPCGWVRKCISKRDDGGTSFVSFRTHLQVILWFSAVASSLALVSGCRGTYSLY